MNVMDPDARTMVALVLRMARLSKAVPAESEALFRALLDGALAAVKEEPDRFREEDGARAPAVAGALWKVCAIPQYRKLVQRHVEEVQEQSADAALEDTDAESLVVLWKYLASVETQAAGAADPATDDEATSQISVA